MKQLLVLTLSAICLLGAAIPQNRDAAVAVAAPRPVPAAHVLRFEANQGQFPADSSFGLRNGAQTVSFAGDGVTFVQPEGSVTMRLLGGNPACEIAGEEMSAGVANYLYGQDPSGWKTNVELFGRVRYRDVYPGIDLVFYDRDGSLEYDFVLQPGASPDEIRVSFDGADSVRTSSAGDLEVTRGTSVTSHNAPIVYQDVDGDRIAVAGRYEVSEDSTVTFDIGPFDPAHSLVIDPGIVYSTLLGGGLSDQAKGVAVDGTGSTYVTGWTASFSFPTRNPIFEFNPGTRPDGTFGGDCFVTKFTPDGSDIVFSTYVGGGLFDEGTAIAVGLDGSIFVAGTTWSDDFPTLHPVRTNNDAVNNPYSESTKDPIVFKISPDGTRLVYSTYLGGSGFDEANDIKVNPAGAAIVVGTTASTDLLTTPNALQPSDPNGSTAGVSAWDGFISKLNPDGTALEFSTYVGDSYGDTRMSAVAIASTGDILVTGNTLRTDFLPGVPLTSSGPLGQGDIFVADVAGDGGSARWLWLLGGTYLDEGHDIALDPEDNVYVAGSTSSPDFPTFHPIQTEPDREFTNDAVLFKLTSDGRDISYATYIGGTRDDTATSLVVNRDNSVIVAGATSSTDFPVVLANFPFANHTYEPYTDGFVAKVNASGSAIEQSTYFGGSDGDSIDDLAAGPASDVAAVGSCGGSGFPVLNAFIADTYDGYQADGFVTRFRFAPLGPAPTITKATGRSESGNRPTRGKITGRGFQPGAVVYAGLDPYAVRLYQTKVKPNGKTIVITDDRYDLHQLFSEEGDHTIIVTNPDGGQAIFHYRK